MEEFKCLIEKSTDLLNEAMHYVEKYRKCEESNVRDLYYSLAQLHLDGYNKCRMTIASYVSKHEKEHNEMPTIWMFIKGMQDEYLTEIKKNI